MAIEDGGPAFPRAGYDGPDNHQDFVEGMSLRDYFAGQALTGILGSRTGFLIDVGTQNAPGWAYQVADAMLAERTKAVEP